MKHYSFLILCCILFLAGCTPSTQPTQAPNPTFTPRPTPTLQPSLTPTLTPQTGSEGESRLVIRTPSLDQIQNYLQRFVPEDSVELDSKVELLYSDLDGDGEKDLIVHSYLSVYLLLWKQSAYTKPFSFIETRDHYGANVKVALTDWTGDAIPEVIMEHLGWSGGTGIKSHRWAKTVIHCTNTACGIVWQNTTALLVTTDDIASQGMNLFLNKPVLLQNDGEKPIVLQLSHAFAFNTDNHLNYSLPEPITAPECYLPICQQNVFQSTLVVYRWTGTTFEKTYEAVTDEAHPFPKFIPRDSNNSILAEVVPLPDKYSFANEKCQLQVEGTVVDGLFDCYPNYAELRWRDVTGDEQAEIVVTVVSGPLNFDGDLVTDKNCTHERMLVYQWNGKQANEVANVTGCVVRENLYGVRLEDIDQDGIMEIIAAAKWLNEERCEQGIVCWEDLNETDEIYKWNGSKFVFWRNIPREDQ